MIREIDDKTESLKLTVKIYNNLKIIFFKYCKKKGSEIVDLRRQIKLL
jgi:hypothetical protein